MCFVAILVQVKAQDWKRFGFKGKIVDAYTYSSSKDIDISDMLSLSLYISFDENAELDEFKYYLGNGQYLKGNLSFLRGTKKIIMDNAYTLTFDAKNRFKTIYFEYKTPLLSGGSWAKKICYNYASGNNPQTEVIYNKTYDIWSGFQWRREVTTKYVYLKYDEAGNWISRKLICNAADGTRSVLYEKRDIKYTYSYDSFLNEKRSKRQFGALIKNSNLKEIHEFALDENTSEKYAKLAKEYWNRKRWQELEKFTQIDSIYNFYFDNATDSIHKTLAREELAEWLWKNQISQNTDYDSVSVYKKYKMYKHDNFKFSISEDSSLVSVFDSSYIRLIQNREDSLKKVNYNMYIANANKAYMNKQYTIARHNLAKASLIYDLTEEQNLMFENIDYEIISEKKDSATVVDSDYVSFLGKYPNSSRTAYIQDERALCAAGLVTRSTTDEERDRIGSLPMSTKTRERVSKILKRFNRLYNQGHFIYFGIGCNFEYGNNMGAVSPELGFKLGRNCQWINGYVGFRYGHYTAIEYVVDSKKEILESTIDENEKETNVTKGRFSFDRFSIPVEIRVNFSHNYKNSIYIGLGGEYNINKKGSIVMNGSHNYNDNLLKKTSFTGRVSLGFNAGHLLDMAIYANYDFTDTFDKDYLNAHPDIQQIISSKLYSKQIDNRLRFGLVLRCFF